MDPGDPTGDPATGERRCTGQDPLLLLQALQTLWSTRERQQLQEEAWRGFAALDDPLAGLLDMLESCRGRRGEGPSLEAWISRQLQCWLQAQPRPSPAQHSLRLKQLQARAIQVLTESPPSLVAPLTSIFQLQDADRSCLLVHVHRLHQEGRFREVSGPHGRVHGERAYQAAGQGRAWLRAASVWGLFGASFLHGGIQDPAVGSHQLYVGCRVPGALRLPEPTDTSGHSLVPGLGLPLPTLCLPVPVGPSHSQGPRWAWA